MSISSITVATFFQCRSRFESVARRTVWGLLAAVALCLAWASEASAQNSVPLIGVIEVLKVDDPGNPWSGGRIVVGGQVVIIPRNMVIELPANFLTLQQIFAQAPAACVALGESGLAASDECAPGGGVATILANRTAAGDVIAGDVFLEKGQETVTGRVSFVSHTDGYFRVSGLDGSDTTGVMVRINDPDGRHTIQRGKGCAGGRNCSPDPRFTNDADNYTVAFSTGYPVCIPSTVIGGNRTVGSDSKGFGDAFCPMTNRDAVPVPDATRFAPLRIGDSVVVQGNFEVINGVRFLSVYDVLVRDAIRTSGNPTQPDYMIFDEVEWDVAGFQNERARLLLIGFSTHPNSQLDIFSLHVDPATNENHEVPLASTVGNPRTILQGVGAANIGIFKIRFDVDFFKGAPVRTRLSPCENLRNAGFGVCPTATNLGPDFGVISPITREIIGRTIQKKLHPELAAFDINGDDAPWGEYLTPVGVAQPEFVEIDLDAISTPFIFAGIPWNLDRRLGPAGCIDSNGDGVVDCETIPQPLDPFPFSGLDPRTQALVPLQARDRILSAFGPNGPATTVMSWPPVDPPLVDPKAVRVDIVRATFKEELDCTKIDVWAESDLAGEMVVTGSDMTPQTMVGDGTGRFFAHISLPISVPVPATITVTQTSDGSSDERPLIDEVVITEVTYDVTTQRLVVRGTSSTAGGSASLTLAGGEPTNAGGEVSILGVQVPPRTVTLASGAGGFETRKVIVNPTLPDVLSVTEATYDQDFGRWTISGTSSVPGPGNAVLVYLGQATLGTLIEAAQVDASGIWAIVTADASPADPNAPGAPATITVQSIPLGGVLDGVAFTRTGTPPPTAPLADAGPDQLAVLGATVQLDGSASSGPFTSFQWHQVAGPVVVLSDPDIVNPTFIFPSSPSGVSVTFYLTVSGALGSADDLVTVSSFDPVNDVPVAVATLDQTEQIIANPADPPAFPTVLVLLDGGESLGLIDNFVWEQTGGPPVVLGELQLDGSIVPNPNTANPAFTVTTPPGQTVLDFNLTVSGSTGVNTTSLTVTLDHTAPEVVADAGPDQIVVAGEFVVLNAGGSIGDGLTYSWAQVGDIPVTGPPFGLDGTDTVEMTFFFPGLEEPLVFELTVTDLLGTSATDTVTISRFPRFPEPSLKTVPVPEPDNLFDFVKDKNAAIALGKTLFWDMQVGGDGVQACASCHHHAGADARFRNTLHPGPNGVFDVGGPNHTLLRSNFPFIEDDIVGSQGVARTDFVSIVPGRALDDGVTVLDSTHSVGSINTRQVTGRQAPSVINAIFNIRSFWDGRANFVFNGVNPFGLRDPNAPTILKVQPDGSVVPVRVAIEKSSLASQAVGPPNNEVEMSWNGRSFPELGRKLLNLRPLARQIVDPTDSVLGGMMHPSGRGLDTTYEAMVRSAFLDRYWDSTEQTPDGFSVMEANFSLFFGLAVQVYESTLVSDDAPYDRFREGDDSALTPQQKHGLEIFLNQALCIECHEGPEFTGATVSNIIVEDPVENMIMADRGTAVYDSAFYNIGVRPTTDDPGVAGTDPFGNPLSFTRLSQQNVVIGPPMLFEPEVDPNLRTAIDGSFKVPSLRNVELTGPYMHSGVFATLTQVVEFYSRGGDFIQENIQDATTSIRPLALTPQDETDLVAFLTSLTDERVRLQSAPFDHPQLFISNGHVGDVVALTDDGTGAAVNQLEEIAAVGAVGGPPILPFAQPNIGAGIGPELPPLGACCIAGVCDAIVLEFDCGAGMWTAGGVCTVGSCSSCSTDGDGDGVPDGCDPCPLDNPDDTDLDGVCDSDDACPGFNDLADGDGDGVADGCDSCPLDNPDDTDLDSVCDSTDACPGFDDLADADGDGVADDCDPCPADNPDDTDLDGVCDSDDICPGISDFATIQTVIESHTVGNGVFPGSSKQPIAGVEVCAYDDSLASCVDTQCGGLNSNSKTCIATMCAAAGCCTTDATGSCSVQVLAGDYVIVAFDPTAIVLPDPLGKNLDTLACESFARKRLKQIVRSDGKKLPAKTTRLTGSDLLIMEPEYILWDGTEQAYPFVFEAVGDWGVTTSVAPPEGFISDFNNLAEFVFTGTEEAVQFTITEVGSDLVPTDTTFEVTHKGRREIIHSKVDIFLTAEYARSRGFDPAVLRANGLIKELPGTAAFGQSRKGRGK